MTDIIDYSQDQVSPAELKLRERQKIKAVAGDSQSVLGSVADGAQMNMLAMGQLLLQLKEGKAIEEIIASHPVFASCIEYADAKASGTMKVPFAQKPEGEAMADLIARTNAVAELY